MCEQECLGGLKVIIEVHNPKMVTNMRTKPLHLKHFYVIKCNQVD